MLNKVWFRRVKGLSQPLGPTINTHILFTELQMSYNTRSVLNCLVLSFCLVIISFILITYMYMFDQVLMLLREIRCWSLLGLKEWKVFYYSPVIKETQTDTKHHMRHTKYNRELHLEWVCEGEFVLSHLPNLSTIYLISHSVWELTKSNNN